MRTLGNHYTVFLYISPQVLVDNLMLNSVSQITVAIRENTAQLADKMK